MYEVALWVAERNFFQEFFNNKKVRLHATALALDLHIKAYLKSIIKTIIVLPIIILSKTNPLPKKGTRMSICSTRRRTLIPWPNEELWYRVTQCKIYHLVAMITASRRHRVCWSPSMESLCKMFHGTIALVLANIVKVFQAEKQCPK